jgi:RNA polymerase sigma-70 factor, ECF subfamily
VLTAPVSPEFVRALTDSQSRLYGYISSLVSDFVAVNEILSASNSTLLAKAEEFSEIKNFGSWALRIAYFEILAYQKKRRSDRHVFDGQLLDEIAAKVERESEAFAERRQALRGCVEKLPPQHRRLVTLRYESAKTIHDIAQQDSKSPNAISQMLFRIHAILAECVSRALKANASG